MSVANIHINPMFRSGGRFSSAAQLGYDVYGFWGQSNIITRATARAGIDDVYSAVTGKVFQYGYSSQTVTAATNPLDHVDEQAGSMGMWLEFCKIILPKLRNGRKILLVPCGQGGTSLNANWSPGHSLNTAAKARINAAMAYGTGTNVLKGFCWLQGETDADLGVTIANLYRPRIQAMYEDFVSTITGMTSSTPFIVGSIKPDKPQANIINTALEDFALVNPAVGFVDLRDLSFFDANHYDAPSVATAGQRYARHF